MSKSLKITFDLNTASYRGELGKLHVQSSEMSVREVEKGIKDCIQSLEYELRDIANCPYHNKEKP